MRECAVEAHRLMADPAEMAVALMRRLPEDRPIPRAPAGTLFHLAVPVDAAP